MTLFECTEGELQSNCDPIYGNTLLNEVELALAIARGYNSHCCRMPDTELVESIVFSITKELEKHYGAQTK